MKHENKANIRFTIIGGIVFIVALVIDLLVVFAPDIANLLYPVKEYRGKIVDRQTGKPVPDADVWGSYIQHNGWSLVDGYFGKKYGNVDCRSDIKGRFTFSMPGFDHRISVNKSYEYNGISRYRLSQFPDPSNILIELEPLP